MQSIIQIGAYPEAVLKTGSELRQLIETLDKCGSCEKVQKLAIKAFTNILQVNNATIRDCTFNMGELKQQPEPPMTTAKTPSEVHHGCGQY